MGGTSLLEYEEMGSCVDSASDRPKCRWFQKKPRTTSLLMNQNGITGFGSSKWPKPKCGNGSPAATALPGSYIGFRLSYLRRAHDSRAPNYFRVSFEDTFYFLDRFLFATLLDFQYRGHL